MHGHDDAAGDDAFSKRDELGRDTAEDHARVDFGGGGGELPDGCRDFDRRAAVHGVVEESVLGADVAEERGGSHPEPARDVRQGRGSEALGGENAAGGVEDLFAADARRAAHL